MIYKYVKNTGLFIKKALISDHRSVLNIALKTQEIAFPRFQISKFSGGACPRTPPEGSRLRRSVAHQSQNSLDPPLVITLLDLKNAFGEVHHNLIKSVLGYHDIPDHIENKINSLYTNFKTSIITSNFSTPFIQVGRGVLQGDCLSPLLFNLCFNTFLQHIKSEKYQQFGFSYKLLNPIHWFQFADDAAVITSQESENQHLLNRFALWCQWSDMIIRVDKCSTFGIRKALTKSVQYLPKQIINNSLIPAIEIGKSFCYLGRYSDFEMTNNEHKLELVALITNLMKEIDLKPLHPKNKILLYTRFVLSKLSWRLTVAALPKTWILENLDSIVNQYIRK